MGDAEITSLKLTFATASGWSEWCTIAVTLGVFVEFLALFIFSKEMPAQEKWVMGIATLIIVLGCGDEYVFGGRASTPAVQLQDASDRQIASLVLAAKNEQGKVAAAQKEAANARLETARLNAMLSPRNVMSPKTFVLAFLAAQNPIGVLVRSYASDLEGARLADEIIRALKSANFVVSDSRFTVLAGPPIAFGVYVSGPDHPLVTTLLSWLSDSRLQPVLHEPPVSPITLGGGAVFTKGTPSATILVGAKPFPPTQ
jgi:hypothetical protein